MSANPGFPTVAPRTSAALAFACAIAVATVSPAQAYLDPGTGSIILQSIIGGLIGGLAILRMYWGRVRGLFRRGAGAADGDRPSSAPGAS